MHHSDPSIQSYDISRWKEARIRKFQERETKRMVLLQKAKARVFEYFKPIPGIKKVYITGSLLQPFKFHRYSDIDIAVEGLQETQYFRTKMELEELLDDTVDLIELENCTFKDKIIKAGLKIL